MTVLKKVNFEKIPDSGYMMAYFRGELVFLFCESGIQEKLENSKTDTLLELHVFDENEEYRLTRTQKGMFIETIISDKTETILENGQKICKDTKIEYVKLEKKYAKSIKCNYLKVINYIDYDKNGMISINNYRLAPVESHKKLEG